MKFVLVPFFCFFLIFSASAENTELQNKKLEYVKGLSNYVMDTMATKDTKANKILKIRKMIEKEMDFEWNAKMALGSHGREMSTQDFHKFTDLYKDLLCKNWAGKFSIAEMTKKQDIVFSEKVSKVNADDDIVSFYISSKNGNKIDIKIVVKTINNDTFKVMDLVAEGVSTALSYREQFNSYIDQHGVKGIIPHLEQVVKKDDR